MSPADAAIIRRKLQHIIASLDGLRPIAPFSLAEYRARFYERKAPERLLQGAIEAALDINAHLITELGAEVPEEYYGGFIKLSGKRSVMIQRPFGVREPCSRLPPAKPRFAGSSAGSMASGAEGASTACALQNL